MQVVGFCGIGVIDNAMHRENVSWFIKSYGMSLLEPDWLQLPCTTRRRVGGVPTRQLGIPNEPTSWSNLQSQSSVKHVFDSCRGSSLVIQL